MQFSQIFAVAFTAFTTAVAQQNSTTTCQSGTYGCQNPSVQALSQNATANIRVCDSGIWMVAAQCNPGMKCVIDKAGGATCQ